MNIPAVLLGADLITLGAIRTLGRHGVKVFVLICNLAAFPLTSQYIHEKVLIPDVTREEQKVAEFLIEFSKRFSEPPVLMASADRYAVLISRYAAELSPYYLFPDNPPGLLEAVINKKELYQLAQQNELLMPKTYFPEKEEDIRVTAGGMKFPCIVKPSISEYFVKVFREKCLVVNDPAELVQALRRVQEEKLEVMVQEIIPGFDDHMYMFDVYINRDGRPTHTFLAQKYRQFPINFGSSTLAHHIHDQEMVDLGIQYISKLGFRGFGEIEFKKHSDDHQLYMIEINARLSRTNALFDACGVEFTQVMYSDLIGKPLPDHHFTEERPWAFWYFYEDIFAVARYRKSKQLTWKQILRPWFSHRKAHAIWAKDDPRPFLSFMKNIWSKLVNKVLRR